VLFAAAWWVCAFVPGVAKPPAEARPSVAAHTVQVDMITALGTITLELYPDQAPVTVANFLRYVDEKRYVGAKFYRTVRPDNDHNPHGITVIQGGIDAAIQGGANHLSSLPPIAHESTQATKLRHTDGTISMAREAPGTAGSEFFICIGDNPSLDFGGRRNPDGLGFAAFGRVIAGMAVVRQINMAASNAPTSEPYVRGQILEKPVEILKVRRARSNR
jgi:peptidyl-prolyl cis-trans isomerase A (cyclophilin A)